MMINKVCQSHSQLIATSAALYLTNWWPRWKPDRLCWYLLLLLSVCQHESHLNSPHAKRLHFYSVGFICITKALSHKIKTVLCSYTCEFFSPPSRLLQPSCSRPVSGALPLMPHGAPAVAGQAADPVGTAWVVLRHTNARRGSPGNDGRFCRGRVAQVQKTGRAEEKEVVDWWRKTMHPWPGRTPCPNRREGPGTGGWSQWRLGAQWICHLMLYSR